MLLLPEVCSVAVPIVGQCGEFPVRRIYCVGQNYADHAREMGSNPERQTPFFFGKPADAIVASGSTIPYPARTHDLHHEVELVVALAAGGVDIAPDKAAALILGFAVGVDLTRRDLQAEAKRNGRPWDMAKGFDRSAPIGPIKTTAPRGNAEISLSVNGGIRQKSDLARMIWTVPEIVAELSRYVELKGGDLIFTGTPAGVGPLYPGDAVSADIDGLPAIEFSIGV